MWRLGDLSIGGPVVLGPMSGYTSAAYREFMRPFGVSMAYTEMVSDQYYRSVLVKWLRLYPVHKFGSKPRRAGYCCQVIMVYAVITFGASMAAFKGVRIHGIKYKKKRFVLL